jgi:hypothetical protein
MCASSSQVSANANVRQAAIPSCSGDNGSSDPISAHLPIPNPPINTDNVGQTTGLGFEIIDPPNLTPLTSVGQGLGYQVPKKIKDKIWNGEFVDLGHMLDHDVMLTDRHPLTLSGVGEGGQLIFKSKALPKVDTIERWTTAFTTFASIYLESHPQVARSFSNTWTLSVRRRSAI